MKQKQESFLIDIVGSFYTMKVKNMTNLSECDDAAARAQCGNQREKQCMREKKQTRE